MQFCNDLGEGIIASVAFPTGDPPPEGWPGVMVLHGSGGLFKSNDDDSCSEELGDQFERWADLLTARGYAVVMPESFYSRGFCEWNDAGELLPELDEHERIIVRTFDAAAAARYMCADPRIDCDRLASVGFSNGASTLMLLYHEDHRDCEDPRLHELDDSLPGFVGGVAYYPGCGLQKELATSLDEEDFDRFFFPHAPLWVAFGSDDGLADNCIELRDPQVELVAEHRGLSQDLFDLQIYPGADHGFDDAEDGDAQADRDASEDAEAVTLALLDAWF